MPLLDIELPTDDYGALAVNVTSIMAYPNDEAKRVEYRDVVLANANSKTLKKLSSMASALVPDKFVYYNSYECVLKMRDNATEKGSIAGSMLCNLYFMSKCGKLPSLEKAKTLTGNFARFDMSDEISVGSSRKPLQEYWNGYKSVSHLWAAMLLWCALPLSIESKKDWLCPDSVCEILALSEKIRIFAESTKIGINDNEKYIFDKETAWRVPASCVIPDCDLSTVASLTTLAAYFPTQYAETFDKKAG